jgi:DNA-binding LytR/AlgR family response regulator
MNAVIIEDEKLSAEHLTTLLKRIDKSIQVIASFDSVKKSVEAFANGLSADLLFLDIHLADGLSFDILKKIDLKTPVIFTTAYDEYAIKAFKFNSIDYLLKPIGQADLKTALEKFRQISTPQRGISFDKITEVYSTINKQFKNRFLVKMGESIVSVKSEDIAHFIAEEGIVLLCTSAGKRYAVDYSMDQLESMVDPKLYFRMNRKVLINISAIQKISTYFNGRLKIASESLGEEESIVSRERVNDFKLWLDS